MGTFRKRCTKTCTLLIASLVCWGIIGRAVAADDWAYELPAEAKEIYLWKRTQIPCSELGKLVQKKDADKSHIAIRDAGLFGDKSCGPYIRRYRDALSALGLSNTVAFYYLKTGDSSRRDDLVKSFDREATRVGDHVTVELFGFLEDWEATGRRLVRHAKRADGAAGETLCSAIAWRRFLYGEVLFEQNWFAIGKQEEVDRERLVHYFDSCRPW